MQKILCAHKAAAWLPHVYFSAHGKELSSGEFDYPEAFWRFGFYFEGGWKHPGACMSVRAVVQEYTISESGFLKRFHNRNKRNSVIKNYVGGKKYGSKSKNQNQTQGL